MEKNEKRIKNQCSQGLPTQGFFKKSKYWGKV